ncbi:MAG: RelA/SpoT family protein [Peptoclostridium sp.]|uniref:RelA/SpoT family protein n=1 Tax=Peptoclostridium sp. TaxID=1904860 RepID=UPI00139C324D|nr:bifunctional (p)ppGpp synthetase/guanosine-3',5'-bis(diphosphate) 3'-pyrophosphohydrolase [Peptoclostridium sp.]MZQ76137.1 RelA/SpoT family protein [Peptoclostridium sp.]
MLENLLLSIEQYSPESNLELIIKAYNLAESAHVGQYRKSGEKYFIHPVSVAKILVELQLDTVTVAAGLLHDVIEDTKYTYEDLSNIFGQEIADLVDGVTKLGKIEYKSKEETQAENIRKMFIAMAKDIRVVLIKLADRLHNMRTLNYMSEIKAQEKARETLEIYAPIANRLGISKIKFELEDTALRYLDPEGYYELVDKVAKKRKEREEYIHQVISMLKEHIDELDVDFEISGRAKHFYSIYRKMHYQGKSFEQIYDLTGVRVIVNSIKDCYAVLGVVHTIWKPLPGRFKDYIAMPKPNMYQSLHTTVVGLDGGPLEIQIRTFEMNKTAELGIAAHWKYKEGKTGVDKSDLDKKLSWLRQMMELQDDLNDPREFMEALKIDLFTNQVFVFSPKGDVVELPAGSTPIDFAYKVHTDVGNKCIGAKVDGRMVPLDYKLKNGNIVHVVTSGHSTGPSRDWLNVAKSTHAKNKIRQWFRKANRTENIEKGKEMLDRELKRNGITQTEALKHKYVVSVMRKINFANEDEMYAAIGYGGITPAQIITKLKIEMEKDAVKDEGKRDTEILERMQEKEREQKPREKGKGQGIIVKGVDNILVRFAKCCNPLPGDDIVGFITKGRGVSIHRRDCSNIDLSDTEVNSRLLEVKWDLEKTASFEAEIKVKATDRRGIISEVTQLLAADKISLNGINARTTRDGMANMTILLQIESKDQLKSIMNKLKNLSGVLDVFRVEN